jgi:AraC family transcriptional regulator
VSQPLPWQEFLFTPSERKMPLDIPADETLPQWGHWLQTPDYMVAMILPGHLEVNLKSPLNLVATCFGPTQGVAAFDSDRLKPYAAYPGGFDVVPQGSTYRSVEEAAGFVVLGYSSAFLARQLWSTSAEDQAVELLPGQIAKTRWGLEIALAVRDFLANHTSEDGFYLESIATAVLGQMIYHRSTLSGRWRRPPEFLAPSILKISLDYIQAHLESVLSLNAIATVVGFSPYHFARAFRATTGMSPYQYVLRARVQKAQRLLQTSRASLTDIAIASGFSSHAQMCSAFKRLLNKTPTSIAFASQTSTQP